MSDPILRASVNAKLYSTASGYPCSLYHLPAAFRPHSVFCLLPPARCRLLFPLLPHALRLSRTVPHSVRLPAVGCDGPRYKPLERDHGLPVPCVASGEAPTLGKQLRVAEMDRALERLMLQVKGGDDVLAVILYGSQARQEASPGSDVDVCLVLAPDRGTRADQTRVQTAYLEFAGGGLDIRIFQQLPLYIRRRILQEGRTVYCRDEDAMYQLSYRTAQQFADFKPIYEAYLAEVAGAGS